MNKIIISKDKEDYSLNENINLEVLEHNKFLNVQMVKIKIVKSTDLELECNGDDLKVDIYINILDNVICNIHEITKGNNIKISYKYYLENSTLNLYKINGSNNLKQSNIFNLNKNSYLKCILKTVCTSKETYDFLVYHNSNKTESLIINNGVNIKEGSLKFNVSGFVPNGIKGCLLNQKNRIINLTDNHCEIKPNLFIEEDDVLASHSAHIGDLNKDELFYLMSRGIPYKDAEKILIKGFLTSGIDPSYIEKVLEVTHEP